MKRFFALIIVVTVFTTCLNAYYTQGNALAQGYERRLGHNSNPSIIWGNNPHAMLTSPGLLGFAKDGLTMNYINRRYSSNWICDCYLYEMNATFYNNGIGLLFPLINADGGFGFSEYRDFKDVDAEQVDNYLSFGAAFNPVDFFDLDKKWEFAAGVTFNFQNYDFNYRNFDRGVYEFDSLTLDGFFCNFGITSVVTPVTFSDNRFFNVELVQGVNLSNVFGNTVEYKYDEQNMGQHISKYKQSIDVGLSGKLSLLSTQNTIVEPISSNCISFLYTFCCENLFEIEDDKSIIFHGAELGILDVFFIDYGFSNDSRYGVAENLFDSDNYGYRIKLSAADYFEILFDETYTINLNLKKIWGKVMR